MVASCLGLFEIIGLDVQIWRPTVCGGWMGGWVIWLWAIVMKNAEIWSQGVRKGRRLAQA